MRNLISTYVPLEQTKNWIIYEGEKEIKVETTIVYENVRDSISLLDFDLLRKGNEQVTFLDFDKEKKEQIIKHLEKNGHNVVVTSGKPY